MSAADVQNTEEAIAAVQAQEEASPPPSQPLEEQIATLQAQLALLLSEQTAVDPVNDSVPPDGQPAPGGGQLYQIQPGDDIFAIARFFYGSDSPANVQKIVGANSGSIIDPDTLQTGFIITIPA